MSKKKRYGAGIGIAGALVPLLTMVVRAWLENRRERQREELDPERREVRQAERRYDQA